MKHTIWVRNSQILEVEGVQAAIVAFALVCSRAYPRKAEATLAFRGSKVAGTVPCIEGWATVRSDPNMHLIAILFDVTEEDWKKYGPPKSLELTPEEMRERGLNRHN